MNRLEATLAELARTETMIARADLSTEAHANVCAFLRERGKPHAPAEALLQEMRTEYIRLEKIRNLMLDRIELLRSQGQPGPAS